MPLKYAANLSFLWKELPYFDRFDAAAAAGFGAVEVLFPYDVAVPETLNALGRNSLRMVLMNAPPPNYTGGARGFAAEPDKVDRFHFDMRRAKRYAAALGVDCLHVMSGKGTGEAAKETLISNLKRAAADLPKSLTLTIEPLNQDDNPGYFMSDYALAAEVIEAVGAGNVGLQFDSYHAQVIHGDAVAVYDAYAPLIRHIQIGDTPKRGAPGTGAVDFKALFARIEASAYKGWISGEYLCDGATEDSLSNWMKPL
ncbi:MAG: TIM barrel protein [Pseudomonadota bacterium]